MLGDARLKPCAPVPARGQVGGHQLRRVVPSGAASSPRPGAPGPRPGHASRRRARSSRSLLQPTSRSPPNCRLRWRSGRGSVSSTCSPPGTPCQSPKLALIRPSVSSTLICVTPRARRAPDHVQRGDTRLLGGVGLDRADDGLAADLVEGLGAVAGGVDAGHAGLQVLVGQHAQQACDARVLEETDVGLDAGGIDHQVGSRNWPLDSRTASGASSAPLPPCDPSPPPRPRARATPAAALPRRAPRSPRRACR